jgi:NAD(P)-dependent dehydrogenase (short-subunit alcohol dehydrogenase family)
MRLAGKVALISGAATSVAEGIMSSGGATARLFIREGARVVLGDIKTDLEEQNRLRVPARWTDRG